MFRPTKFFQEVQTELKKVIWPTQRQAARLTLVVIAISIAVGLFIASLDFILTKIMAFVIK